MQRNLILKDNVTGIWHLAFVQPRLYCIWRYDSSEKNRWHFCQCSIYKLFKVGRMSHMTCWIGSVSKNGLGQTMKLKLWTTDITQTQLYRLRRLALEVLEVDLSKLTSPASPSLSNLSSCFSVLIRKVTFFGVLILDNNFILHKNRIFRANDSKMYPLLNTAFSFVDQVYTVHNYVPSFKTWQI